MAFGRTVTGRPFEYSGSLADGLVVAFEGGTTKRIRREIIDFVKTEIDRRSPVRMGANRDPLVPDSIDETLRTTLRESPQVLSYIVPLLVESGFCRATKSGRNWVIHRR